MSRYGLLGRTLRHSFSPFLHQALGNGEYKLIETEPEDVAAFFAARDFNGVNVTIPYKKDAFEACDTLSDTAKRVGAVNTVVNRDGKLYGDNTDYSGFAYMLRRGGADVKGKNVLVLGSGGTSLTACAVLEDLGAAEIGVVSRSGALNYSNVYGRTDTDIIINTTPVGMYPDCGVSPIDLTRFPHLSFVADVIYNPEKTRLLLDAEALHIPHIGGLAMLCAQAVRSDAVFMGKSADDGRIEALMKKCTDAMRNIVLTGMPGCGKTTVGKKLAQKLGRKFYDTDELYSLRFGKTPEQAIIRDGEAVFRNGEAAVLADVTKESGAVIATGGGVVTRVSNRDLLRQNGVIVYLTRSLEKLATEGRPLSADLEALYRVRAPLYEAFADVTAEVREDTEKSVCNVLAALGRADMAE